MKREQIRMLIVLSPNVEEADKVIVNAGFTAVREKIAFLKGMFDFNLVGRFDGTDVQEKDAEEMDYYAILNTIINGKWEG